MAFLNGAAERPHHAYVFAGPEGSGKSIAARAFVAALLCPDGGCGDVPRVPPGAGGSPPERVPGGARGTGHPRGHHPGGDLDARLPDGARAGPQGVRDPRGRPALAGRRRHAAQGARGAAGRLHPAADVGACARAARHRPVAVPRGHVHGAVRGVRRRGAGGRRRRRHPCPARRAARRREPRPRAPPGDRRRRPAVPRRRRTRGRARRRRADRRARGRRRRARRRRRVQEGPEGRARDRARAVPRREGPSRGRLSGRRSSGSRSASIAGSAVRSATTSIGSCWRSRRSCATGSPARWAAAPTSS